MNQFLSLNRIYAVLAKEFTQLKRERTTYAMILLLPVIQILVFGYAINNDPHHLPTAVLSKDYSSVAKSIVTAFENTKYFKIDHVVTSELELNALLKQGKVQFAITIPEDFTYNFVNRKKAQVLLEADAADPTTIASAISAANGLAQEALTQERAKLGFPPQKNDFEVIVHKLYNPENITTFNIIPGLLSVILTMTLVMQTALAVTREIERGTMESLLSTPATSVEIMIGKLSPYVLVGFAQTIVALSIARLLFNLPLPNSSGAWLAFSIGVVLFILGNLAIGYLVSTLAKSQLQAMQMSLFYMLPSMFLTGFAFPFYGMPFWAQKIGSFIPGTHFLRIIRGALLKNQQLSDMTPSLLALSIIVITVCSFAVLRSRKTLD
ncbi:ABC transporter permease [Desulfovibrio litoralis]|uniref:ABC-2 type transport system permease protein n=1 Tax=Desulfovibrio litoralis DSM 11393 TaxID=1121455 RepID=A0A1M7SPQ7_9BACT|nr:ABC transporter permease [Desulfovibrio litoralis]SHN60517.1 ABC-2 type transport system permease protein [Desulfovibrio litoralis DSM 11393]